MLAVTVVAGCGSQIVVVVSVVQVVSIWLFCSALFVHVVAVDVLGIQAMLILPPELVEDRLTSNGLALHFAKVGGTVKSAVSSPATPVMTAPHILSTMYLTE